jgi:tRNA threonylcarbamoyladenosine biosynthesis protein TsaB
MTDEPRDATLDSPLTLGIETSGLAGSIALCRGAECLAEAQLEQAPRRHAQTLVSQIGALLAGAKLRVRDLEAVAVSIGPGSFTGLRVGVVCAKTLAYATGCQLIAVDTLSAIAANSPADVSRVHVIADALRGDAYVSTYRLDDGAWTAEHPPAIAVAASWLAARTPSEAVSGPGLAVYAQSVPSECRQLPQEYWAPHARVIARLGLGRLKRGDKADCASLVPFYLRRSAAEERKAKVE